MTTRAERERKEALLAEALPSKHVHLDDLLIRYAAGEDLRYQIIDNIVGYYSGMKDAAGKNSLRLLRGTGSVCYDGPLWASIEQAMKGAEEYGQKRAAAIAGGDQKVEGGGGKGTEAEGQDTSCLSGRPPLL